MLVEDGADVVTTDLFSSNVWFFSFVARRLTSRASILLVATAMSQYPLTTDLLHDSMAYIFWL